MLPKVNDGILHPTSSDSCALPKGDNSITIPNTVRQCVHSKSDDGMPRTTSSDLVYVV